MIKTKKKIIIKAENISKLYGKFEALRGINFTIEQGDVVVIVGPSGSGKSTFLKCLNLLEIPNSGKIFIDNEDILKKHININKIRSKIGIVFQQFNLFPHMNVLQNITLAPKLIRKFTDDEAKEKAIGLLRRIGMEEKAYAYPENLSGGEQQRAAIARALAMDPEIMLFDEPTSSLDPEMIKEVLNVMLDLAKEGMTMIVVTHEMGFAREVANKVVFLDNGCLIEEGLYEQMLYSPKSKRVKEFFSKIL